MARQKINTIAILTFRIAGLLAIGRSLFLDPTFIGSATTMIMGLLAFIIAELISIRGLLQGELQ